MARLPPRRKERDPISASEHNQILDALSEALRSRPDQQLMLLGLIAATNKRMALGKITAAPPPDELILPSQCRYSAVALGRGWEVTDILPKYGRQVENDEVGVYPAKVGDLCAILRNPQGNGDYLAELWVFRENPGRGPCPELAPLIGGNGGSSVGGVGGGGGGSEGPPNDPSGPGDPGGGTPIGGGVGGGIGNGT